MKNKLTLALRSLFSRNGRNLLRMALLNRSVVPLFRLQSSLSRSFLPGPTMICIEPTNRCNLNCQMCVRRYWDPAANPLGDMSFEFFARHILGHLKPYQIVNLQCVGESLISKDFLPMLRACKEVGCVTTFTTNGVVLKRYADAVVDLGADEVCISIDGIETLKKLRKVDIGRIFEGIDAVNAAKRRQGKKSPLLAVNCVVTRDNLPELPELVDLLGEKAVSRLTLIHLIAYDTELIGQSVIPIHTEAEKVFATVRERAKKQGIELLEPPPPGARFKCRQPLRSLFINWNGDVRPCCMSTLNEEGALLVGNVSETPIPALWNSNYMHQLRRALERERELPAICGDCPIRRCDMKAHLHLFSPASGGADGPAPQ